MSELDKKFESRFKQDWLKSFPGGKALRLPDQRSKLKGSTNPCDFICYSYPYQFMIECKTHAGNTLPWAAFRQYDLLCEYIDVKGIIAGIVCWFYEKDVVLFVPIKTCKQMKADGLKSVSLKNLDGYDVTFIPSVKLRKFFESDYTVLCPTRGDA